MASPHPQRPVHFPAKSTRGYRSLWRSKRLWKGTPEDRGSSSVLKKARVFGAAISVQAGVPALANRPEREHFHGVRLSDARETRGLFDLSRVFDRSNALRR